MQKLSNLVLPHHNPWITARVTFTVYWRGSFIPQIKRFFVSFCFKKGNIFSAQNLDLLKCARITLHVNSQNEFIAHGNILIKILHSFYYMLLLCIIRFLHLKTGDITDCFDLHNSDQWPMNIRQYFALVFQVKCFF